MEEINFWHPHNFSDWREFRDFWREHYERAGKPIADDSDSFWQAKYKEISNGK